MKEYHKIQTIFKRNPETKYKTLLEGDYSMPEFEYLKNTEWVFTEKVDGTNIRVMFDGEKITFGGKTERAQIPANLVTKLNDRFLPQLDQFKSLFSDEFGEAKVCFYGEGYGAKIQKGGGNYRHDQDFVLFDIKIGEWWLERDTIRDIAEKFGLDRVPVVHVGNLESMVQLVRKGFNSDWGDFTAEGVVGRPTVELFTRNGKRIITKLKHKDFA